jgi:hypothetical protein
MTAPTRSEKSCLAHPYSAVWLKDGVDGHFHVQGCCGGTLTGCGGELR